MIPSREQRALVRQQLAETKHAKLLLKTDQPVGYVLLFFIAWHVATARLYFRQVHRLPIAIVRKKDCDELIDEMLSCSGGTAEKQRYEGTAGDSLASPDASSGGGHEVTGQSRQQPAAPDRVQNYRERLASVAAGGQAGRYGLLAHGKALTASHIQELDDSEIERRPLRGETRGGDDEDTGICSAPALCGGGIYVSPDPG